jgi:hypothetical protein
MARRRGHGPWPVRGAAAECSRQRHRQEHAPRRLPSERLGRRLFDRGPAARHYEVSAALCADNAVVTKRRAQGRGSVTETSTRLRPGGEGRADDGHLRLRHAGHGLPDGLEPPDWFDVIRPTKLPSFDGEFGKDGPPTPASAEPAGRQGQHSDRAGTIKTIFEFELFGTASTPARRRSGCATPGASSTAVGAGQTWSPFMDPTCSRTRSSTGDRRHGVLPQRPDRWQPIDDEHMPSHALERRRLGRRRQLRRSHRDPESEGRFPYPTLSSAKWGGDWGYVRAAASCAT